MAGLATTLVIALLGFGYGRTTLPDLGPTAAVAGALAEALFVAGTILWIIFPRALHLRTPAPLGRFRLLRESLAGLSDDRRILAILVA